MNKNFEQIEHRADVCVVGGGMAGLIAAVASARRGAKTILIHDRAVLGGNASSEVRMWICGARGPNQKETGILEEIQLANLHRNPSMLYTTWDSVLFEYARWTPGLETLLNTTCLNGEMEDGHLVSVDAWQLTTQIRHKVNAKLFIDCSGDSVLAPITGATTRWGREAREEFGEPIAPPEADLKTMGNSILIQFEETDRAQPFTPPAWAYDFDDASNLPQRLGTGLGENFWWIELGGLDNTIRDAEHLRDELLKVAWGAIDYLKNRGAQADKLRNWRPRFVGSHPGKRENRRYLGHHILTQLDIESEGKFDDIVAYGGWTMDDHHPAGLLYPGPATIHHRAPSPYGIPLRCLFSSDVPNLLFAGRNISATHAALSSTRVMATCSVIGQAAGAAAALCAAESVLPARISGARLRKLQAQLMEDDCFLPWKERAIADLTREARLTASRGGDAEVLLNGWDRPWQDAVNYWEAPADSAITLAWDAPREVNCLRMVLDSNLKGNQKKMPYQYGANDGSRVLPEQLLKAFRIEAQSAGGKWETLHEEGENRHRLCVMPIRKECSALRVTALQSWGMDAVRLFSLEARPDSLPSPLEPPQGEKWSAVINRQKPEDLAAPQVAEGERTRGTSRMGA